MAPVKLNRYKDDILFYMFYTNVGDVLQMAAAAELYNRDWRYYRQVCLIKCFLNLDDAAGITKRSEYGSPERLEWLLVKRQQATNAALTTSSMSTRGGR